MVSQHVAHSGRGTRGGFTLIELLVVVAVIAILAALLMPAILTGMRAAQTANCITQLRQIAQANVSYQKDWSQWMLCGGNRNGVHPKDSMNLEKNWEYDWKYDAAFPFWYEALQPYINAHATMSHAVASYKAREGSTLNPANAIQRDKLRTEVARLCQIYTCPAKKQSTIGYGYSYDAPFGNSACYPNDKCPDFVWYDQKAKPYDFPTYAGEGHWSGTRAVIPILWYASSVHASALTVPSAQIAFCDTGKVTNDTNLDVDPPDWVENNDSNFLGFVRFPLHDHYRNTTHYKSSYAWRPVPRHGNKTVCVMFDGSAKAIGIRDVVGPRWADDECLLDNIPPHKPPVPPRPH